MNQVKLAFKVLAPDASYLSQGIILLLVFFDNLDNMSIVLGTIALKVTLLCFLMVFLFS